MIHRLGATPLSPKSTLMMGLWAAAPPGPPRAMRDWYTGQGYGSAPGTPDLFTSSGASALQVTLMTGSRVWLPPPPELRWGGRSTSSPPPPGAPLPPPPAADRS